MKIERRMLAEAAIGQSHAAGHTLAAYLFQVERLERKCARPTECPEGISAGLNTDSAWRTLRKVARVTGLEPAASGVTGRRSNQLSYTRVVGPRKYDVAEALSRRIFHFFARLANFYMTANPDQE